MLPTVPPNYRPKNLQFKTQKRPALPLPAIPDHAAADPDCSHRCGPNPSSHAAICHNISLKPATKRRDCCYSSLFDQAQTRLADARARPTPSVTESVARTQHRLGPNPPIHVPFDISPCNFRTYRLSRVKIML